MTDLEALVTDQSRCLASEKIVVEGERVGFMMREEPTDDRDSGWRFFAENEAEARMRVYDVNQVANCDRDIVEHLSAPIGTAFERAGDSFVETPAELP